MTEVEVIELLQELHRLGLANEPKNHEELVYSWLMFFKDDDPEVINKACYMYVRLDGNHFWPAPGDIEKKKTKAAWLVEIDREKRRSEAVGASQKIESEHTNFPYQRGLQSPTAPVLQIRPKTTCEICGLCEEQDHDKCPCDF